MHAQRTGRVGSARNGKLEQSRSLRVHADSVWSVNDQGNGFRSGYIKEYLDFDLVAGKRVLDFGCGRLSDVMGMCLTFGAGSYTGIDISELPLKMNARDLWAIRGEGNTPEAAKNVTASFVQANGCELPFKDGSFEIVFALDALQLFGPYAPLAVDEIARVSARGATISVTLGLSTNMKLLQRMGIGCEPLEFGYGAHLPEMDGESPYTLFMTTPAKANRMMERSGISPYFTDIQGERLYIEGVRP